MIHATDFYSRGSIVSQYVAGLVAAIFLRLALSRIVDHWLSRGVIHGRKVVAIGLPDSIKQLLARLRQDGPGAEVVDTIALAAASPDGEDEALRRLEALARRIQIDEIVMALPWQDHARIRALVERLSTVPATIHLAPDPSWVWIREPVLARVGRTHTLRLARAPLTLKDRGLKRVFDIVVASALLVAAAPVLALISLAIKLDSPGPVLFRQRRNGFNQREFRVFKFRTMTTLDDGDVVRQAQVNDSRVTRVGRFLRRTNLDEVPQLLNVIAGDMSLVGPRPHAVAHNNEYEERIRLYARRHNVKPGITGWAQVNGLRGETSTIDKMARRVEHDLYYIDHWSVPFDLKIMLMTLFSPRSYRNAY
jgi:Undecaprenyl-phosphate glucose phosphotransferase